MEEKGGSVVPVNLVSVPHSGSSGEVYGQQAEAPGVLPLQTSCWTRSRLRALQRGSRVAVLTHSFFAQRLLM